MRLLALLLLLTCGQAWAVTYYIDTNCEFNGNGTGASGDCAVSGGAAGAFNTGASWFNGIGNTTFFKRGTIVTNFAAVISSATQIFDDYGDASAANPLLSKSGGAINVSINANDITFNDIDFTGNQSSAIVSTLTARTSINRGKIYNNRGAGVGMRFNTGSSDGSLTDVTIYDIDDDGVGISAAATGAFTITRLTCYGVDKAGGQGDCIQMYDGAAASLIVSGGSYTKETGFKQAIRTLTSGSVLIKDRPTITLAVAGAQAISVEGTGTFTLTSAYVIGVSGAPLIFATTTGLTNISGAILVGGDYGIWESHATGTANVFNVTARGQAIAAIYHTTTGAGGSMDVKNSYIDAPINIFDAHASATTTANYNRYGPSLGEFRNDGTVQATLSAWQSATAQDANSLANVTPRFVGGSYNVILAGFCPMENSPLRGAGLYIGPNVMDYYGIPQDNPASIGAIGRNCGGRGTTNARQIRP